MGSNDDFGLDALLGRAASGDRPMQAFEEELWSKIEAELDSHRISRSARDSTRVVAMAVDEAVEVYDVPSPGAPADGSGYRWHALGAAAAILAMVAVVAIFVSQNQTTVTADVAVSVEHAETFRAVCVDHAQQVRSLAGTAALPGANDVLLDPVDRPGPVALRNLRMSLDALTSAVESSSADLEVDGLLTELEELDRLLTSEESFVDIGRTEGSRFSAPGLAALLSRLFDELEVLGIAECGTRQDNQLEGNQ